MNMTQLLQAAQPPALYEKGDSVMWTDPHISGELLKIHLDPSVEAATRSPSSITPTLEIMESFCWKRSTGH